MGAVSPAGTSAIMAPMSDLTGVGIAFVNVFPGPRLGGGEVHLLHLARGVQAEGMPVTIVALPGSGLARIAKQEGFHVIEDDLRAYTLPVAASRLAKHLRRFRVRIVQGSGYFTNMLARLAGKRAGCAVVDAVLCEPSSTLAFEKGLRGRLSQLVRNRVDRATASRADVTVTVAQAIADELIAAGADPARVTVVHNSVDPLRLREAADLGEPPEDMPPAPVIGTLGRLEAVKGLKVLLDAVPLVAEKHPDARFVIAGEGPVARTLNARVAKDPALAERVTLPGFVSSSAGFLSALTVYCLPSLSEGFNTTILEALALGVPVVATDVGGTREVIEDAVTGRLVPANDPAALAEAICWMLDHPRLRERTASAGRERVEAEFTTHTMVARTLDVYRRLLDAQSSESEAPETAEVAPMVESAGSDAG
jgi:glycosyltransferase involved in cell wall biosynthesis